MAVAASKSRWAVSDSCWGLEGVGARVPLLKFPGKVQDFFFPPSLLNLLPMGEVSGAGRGLLSWPSPSFLMLLRGSPYHANCPGPIYSTK